MTSVLGNDVFCHDGNRGKFGAKVNALCVLEMVSIFHVLRGQLSYFVPTNTQQVQDQTKNVLSDGRCTGFPTTNGQSLVCGLPGILV